MSNLVKIVIGFGFWCLLLGALGGYLLPHPSHLKGHNAEYFDPKTKPGTIFKTYIPDMDVIIHFKSSEQINKDEGTKWSIYAYTTVAQQSKYGVCEISMPSGKSILGVANDDSSLGEMFTEKYFPKALAHELLHCIRGDFHE